ncbi:rhomboid-domain-containing protein [Rhizopogon vinicolor AM-OR11-026]|uniref:Rhomboid-domain-containing protein n=1 Tax=Rhizopogon vinicolor AM-OR11-026 TaxID=1314800 RepID=A0A1B7N742_9AGAM|nr:rhomboid-domain-containing protein [Rhizopogon vinicolor AM-OR11-026]
MAPRLVHNTLRQLNLPVHSPQLKPLVTIASLIHAPATTVASPLSAPKAPLPGASLSSILQFARTQLRNATHRDVLRSGQSSFRRPPRRPNWLDSINGNVIFIGIIAINASVFLLWQGAKSTYQTTRDPTLLLFLHNNFLVNWKNITSGRVWTLITSCFSHQDIEHALFNGLSFYFMAPSVMQVLGNTRFLGLYFFGGIASSVASLVWNRFYKNEINYSSHGASGAILANIAFYACAFPRTTFLIFFVIPCPAWAFLPGILAFDVYRSVTDARTTTDTAGHVGGMLSGIGFYLWKMAIRR